MALEAITVPELEAELATEARVRGGDTDLLDGLSDSRFEHGLARILPPARGIDLALPEASQFANEESLLSAHDEHQRRAVLRLPGRSVEVGGAQVGHVVHGVLTSLSLFLAPVHLAQEYVEPSLLTRCPQGLKAFGEPMCRVHWSRHAARIKTWG